MSEIQSLCRILLAVITYLYLYLSVYIVVGFFTTKRFPRAASFHRYGIVIAARNEERVLGSLLASIRAQRYPQELITVFVVADNCTDRTAAVARAGKAVCYERFDPQYCTKGYALQFLFRQIQRDYGTESFDGYLILDADNLLRPDYLEKMNDAFDSGEKIITSYRNTRNPQANWIAASYAIHWMRTIRLEHRARSLFGLASRLQGTGILFASELVRDGWNYTMLTEDRCFCADAVIRGYSISYQNEAEFYDEQPTDLHIAMRQRIRWAKGHLQAFGRYGPGLLSHAAAAKTGKEKFMSWDMFLITFPKTLICTLLKGLAACAAWFLAISSPDGDSLHAGLVSAGTVFFLSWLRQSAMAAYVLFMERRHLPQLSPGRLLWYCITFFLFDLIGKAAVCIAAVSRVEWRPIPHYGERKKEEEGNGVKQDA